ncbi:MAG: 4Fe-4S binding protein [Methanobacterium sp.]
MAVSAKKAYKPLREIEVEYEIDDKKCKVCKDRPCLEACPVDALHEISPDNHIEIDEKCIGCVLCREACPYDAITMKTTLAEPIREPVPVINPKLCLNCGACVGACSTGAIELVSSGGEEVHSVIDEDKCIRCGYCARVCPAEAIKYGEILPRSVIGGKAVSINQDECVGCMTCTRVCPAKGAINVGQVNKLPFIDPSYCARCEECMNVCPSAAIKYLPRDVAQKKFTKLKTMEIVSELLEKETDKLSEDAVNIDALLNKVAFDVSSKHDEDEFELDVTDKIKDEIKEIVDGDLEIGDIKEIIDRIAPKRDIGVVEESCIGCGECINQCPVDCIELEMPSPIHIGEECVYCGKCVEACPFESISLKEEYFETQNGKILFMRKALDQERIGEIAIDNIICQSCGVCINKCPVDALSFEGEDVVVNKDECILCDQCETICPVSAIKLKSGNDTSS